MANNSWEDFSWASSESLSNKLAGIQQSLSKLSLRKERYADTIREALKSGRLKEQEISGDLNSKLQNLLEKMAAKGLAKSGATNMLAGQLEKDAALAKKKAEAATAQAIRNAQSQISQVNAEQDLSRQEILRLLQQANK